MRNSFVVTGGGRGVGRKIVERLLAKQNTVVIIERDPAAWASYSVHPLKVAPRPDSMLAEMLWDDIQVNLDYLIETQTEMGSWEPNWTWGDLYPDVWPLAKKEWSGHITLENLLTLRAYGRIAGA